jgi:hypothetical protein
MEKIILILAMALIFVLAPFDFNDLLHLAFALSGFRTLDLVDIKERSKQRSIYGTLSLAPLGLHATSRWFD